MTFLGHHAGTHTAAVQGGGWLVALELLLLPPQASWGCRTTVLRRQYLLELLQEYHSVLPGLVTQPDGHVLHSASPGYSVLIGGVSWRIGSTMFTWSFLLTGFSLDLPAGTNHCTVRLDPGKVF